MPWEKPTPNRRTLLRVLTTTSLLAGVPTATASFEGSDKIGNIPDRIPLDELAIEVAFNPKYSAAAITTLGLGDGYQVYLVNDVESRSDDVRIKRDLIQISNANIGVHGIHWTDRQTLRHSEDNKTLERTFEFKSDGKLQIQSKTQTIVDNNPMPVHSSGQVTTYVNVPYPIDCKDGGNVCCTDLPVASDFCVRATGSDTGHAPECNSHNPPPMPHGHFAIYPEGNYRGGVNFWIGKDANCIWVGEEHGTGWCEPICGPEGGLPSLSDLRDAFEEAINRSAEAAGIAIPGIVVTALAYYLAASTLAPPTGVPLV